MIGIDPFSIALGIAIGAAVGGWKANHRWSDAIDLPEKDEKKAPAAATAEAQELNNIFNDYSLPRLDVDEKRVA